MQWPISWSDVKDHIDDTKDIYEGTYVVDKVFHKLGIKEEIIWEKLIDTEGAKMPFEPGKNSNVFWPEDVEDPEIVNKWAQISIGDICKVVWDDVEYIAAVSKGNTLGDKHFLLGGTGYPFLFEAAPDVDYGTMIFAVNEYEGILEHSFTIYLQTETKVTTPIDQKYLPIFSGGGLPVVELTTVPNLGKDIELTAEETAAVANVIANNDYAIVKFPFGSLPGIAVCMKTEAGGSPSLTGYISIYVISLVVLDGIGMVFLENTGLV